MSLFESASLVVTPNGTKASKLYAIKPTSGAGDLSVTRATTATRVNSAGLIESVAVNVPRLDYTNSTCPSILVEPQRTNLFTYSQNFSDASWTKINIASVTTGITDPANGTTAVRLASGIGTNGIVTRTLATTIGTPYTVTIWIKGTANGTINFNHAGITLAPQNNISYTTQWQKFQYNFTADSIASEILIGAFFSWSSGEQIDFTFAQIEAGSYPTSYIPTVASSVTRNADVISKTGISSLIGTEFTLFLDAYETTGGNSTRYLILKGAGGTYANAIFLEANASNQIAVTILNSSSSSVFSSIATGLTNGQRFKLAIRCKNNDFAFYVNGVQIATQTSGTVPTTADLYLGYYTDYDDNYNKINSSVIWKTALTNAELAELTTL
jgi:hypothetical protein